MSPRFVSTIDGGVVAEKSTAVSEDSLLKTGAENGFNFESLVEILSVLEKESEVDISNIRKAYDSFLHEFPLCESYWKKYADHEGKIDSNLASNVYERAVNECPYSVTIWHSYCQFKISVCKELDGVRRLFERALEYVGFDYRSNILWDAYIEFEKSQEHLASIFLRALQTPTDNLDAYLKGLHELVAKANTNFDVEGPVESRTSDLIADGQHKHAESQKYRSEIINFERKITKYHFDMTPLVNSQISNWHQYLDFTEKLGKPKRVINLYERCLITCALYSEFWMRYAQYLSDNGDAESALKVLERGISQFVKREPEILLFRVRFMEFHEKFHEARKEYQRIYLDVYPGWLESIVAHASMELRLGDTKSACAVYERAIANEKEKESSYLLPELFLEYAKFLLLDVCDYIKSRELINELVKQCQLTKKLLKAVIHLESASPEARAEFLDSIVNDFITRSEVVSHSDREEISSEFIKVLDRIGSARLLGKALTRHRYLFVYKRATISPSNKRNPVQGLTSGRDKILKTDAAASSHFPSEILHSNQDHPCVSEMCSKTGGGQPVHSQAQMTNREASYVKPKASSSAPKEVELKSGLTLLEGYGSDDNDDSLSDVT